MGQFKYFSKKSGKYQLLWSLWSFLIFFVLPSNGFRSNDGEFQNIEEVKTVPVPVGYNAEGNGQFPLKSLFNIPVLPQSPNVFQRVLANYQKNHRNQEKLDQEVETKPNVFQKVLANYQKNHRNQEERETETETKSKPNVFQKVLANYQKNHRNQEERETETETKSKPNVFQKVLANYQKNHRNEEERESESESESETETKYRPNIFERTLSDYERNQRNLEIIKAYERQRESPNAFQRVLANYKKNQKQNQRQNQRDEESSEEESTVSKANHNHNHNSPNIFQKTLSNYKKNQMKMKQNENRDYEVVAVVPKSKSRQHDFHDTILYYNQGLFKNHDMRNGKPILSIGDKQRKLKKLRMAKHHQVQEQESPAPALKIRHDRRRKDKKTGSHKKNRNFEQFNTDHSERGINTQELGTQSDIDEDSQHDQPKSAHKPQKIKKNKSAETHANTLRLKRKSEDGEPGFEEKQDNKMMDISGETPVFVDVNSELNMYHPLKELRKAQYELDKQERKLFEHNLFMEKVLHRRKLVRG